MKKRLIENGVKNIIFKVLFIVLTGLFIFFSLEFYNTYTKEKIYQYSVEKSQEVKEEMSKTIIDNEIIIKEIKEKKSLDLSGVIVSKVDYINNSKNRYYTEMSRYYFHYYAFYEVNLESIVFENKEGKLFVTYDLDKDFKCIVANEDTVKENVSFWEALFSKNVPLKIEWATHKDDSYYNEIFDNNLKFVEEIMPLYTPLREKSVELFKEFITEVANSKNIEVIFIEYNSFYSNKFTDTIEGYLITDEEDFDLDNVNEKLSNMED